MCKRFIDSPENVMEGARTMAFSRSKSADGGHSGAPAQRARCWQDSPSNSTSTLLPPQTLPWHHLQTRPISSAHPGRQASRAARVPPHPAGNPRGPSSTRSEWLWPQWGRERTPPPVCLQLQQASLVAGHRAGTCRRGREAKGTRPVWWPAPRTSKSRPVVVPVVVAEKLTADT